MALRPLSSVPRPVCWLLGAALLLQVGWQMQQRTERPPRARALDAAPPALALRLLSLDERAAMSRLLMLYVQQLDEQPGLSPHWNELDYPALAGWLELALQLDPRSNYPLLAASAVYGAVNEPQRARLMLDFVFRHFAEDPDRRWPWLAQASLIARHRLHDLPLARRYAAAIRLQATGKDVPPWAHELELFILEDMNELDSARLLAGALLRDGRIRDPQELRFLARRLEALGGQAAGR